MVGDLVIRGRRPMGEGHERLWEQIGLLGTEPIRVFDLDLRLIAFNQAHNDEFFRVNGFYTKLGDVFPDLFIEKQRPVMRSLMQRALTGEPFTVVEEFGKPELGAPQWEISYNALRDGDGRIYGAFHRARDLSDSPVRLQSFVRAADVEPQLEEAHFRRREAERTKVLLEGQLRQAQKMEAVGQLTGGLAHDFNNLLASLSGNLQVLRLRLVRGRVDDLMRRIDAGLDSVRRASNLTQRLLAFSRQQALDARPTEVNRLVIGMQELIRGTIGPAIRWEAKLEDGLWLTKVDASQLESALLNLCINARDAMEPAGGTLTIRTANEALAPAAAAQHDLLAGDFVCVSVTDTGCGIAPNIIARVFDPFFTTKPLGQGTGLGLSMVYGFLCQSGGQVRIQSTEGLGTTMLMYLPRHVGALDPDAESAPLQDGESRRGESILVVEDEPAIRELLVELLEEAGYVVLAAEDGASAIRILNSEARLHLLLSDVGLPGGMNGRQLADMARVARPMLRVLFLTGYAENAATWTGQLEAGMHVMTKPFDVPVLKDVLSG